VIPPAPATIDAHCHFLPPAYLDLVRRDGARLGVGLEWIAGRPAFVTGSIRVPITPLFIDLAAQQEEMDTSGVGVRVLSPPPQLFQYAVDRGKMAEVCRLVNDATAEAIAKRGDRFAAWALLPLQDPVAAAREAERAVRSLDMRGLYIGSNVSGRGLDAPELHPVYEAAQALDVPILIHPWEPAGMERLGEYSLLALAGFLFDTTIQTVRLIFSGMLDRFPRLTFVLCHAGGYLIPLVGRIRRECAVTASMGAALKRPLTEYLRQFAYDTIGLDPRYLRHVIETVGVDRFVLGSDRPFPLGDPDPVETVRALELPAADRDAIFAGNARRLLRL
jgi:aminocarboxymuconate-semialdehyde decarboxylase